MKIKDSKEMDLLIFSIYRNKNLNCSFAQEPITRPSGAKASNKKNNKPIKLDN